MKGLSASVLCIAFIVLPVIKASDHKRTIVGITVVCYDPKDVCKVLKKPCKNGGTCSPADDDEQYKCTCPEGFGGKHCQEKFIKLKVEDIGKKKVVLRVDSSQWSSYVVNLTNVQSKSSREFIVDVKSRNLIKIDNLEPYTDYKVQVRAKNLGQWSKEVPFKTRKISLEFTKERPPKLIHVKLGKNLTIECNASGIPKPTVEWTGLQLSQGQSRQKYGKLIIIEVQMQDSRNYTCKASNNLEEITTVTEVVVIRSPQDFSFRFPKKSITDYVQINKMPSLVAFTGCFWMRSNDQDNEGTPFSYAISGGGHYNELLMYNYRNFDLCIGQLAGCSGPTSVSANDGLWHHICFTWENTDGSWNIYKNGASKSRNVGLRQGYKITGGGILILGQEQDSLGGGFQKFQSFVGEMSGVNVWNRVLTAQEIFYLSKSCNTGEGNVFKWSHFKSGVKREVQVIEPSACTTVFLEFTKGRPPRFIYVHLGENLTIEGNASGIPKPTVEWTGLQLPQARSRQKDGKLIISEVQMQDSGIYTCKVSNNLEEIIAVTKVVVVHGSQDFSFRFPKKSITDYVQINGMPSLVAFTGCFWMRSNDQDNEGTPFSYAIGTIDAGGHHNELLMYNYKDFKFDIGQYETSGPTSVSANDGLWHHICFTWENTAGSWKIYKDGVLGSSGNDLKKAYTIGGDGIFVLGQEQDSLGGGFQKYQSFVGEMSGVNVWNRVLTAQEIFNLSKSCNTGEGNVFKWSYFKSGVKGAVQVIQPSNCTAG